MKNAAFVYLAFCALALISAGAYADGNQTYETDNQVAAFISGLGAQVRLAQLELSIEKNIEWGERIIEVVKTKNETSASELEALLAEMKALKEEVANTTPTAGEDAARQFVDMKQDAIELTKEFRDLARTTLKESDIEGLKRALGWINSNKTAKYAWKINESRNRYNAEKLEELLKAGNITNQGLIDRIRNGAMSVGEAKKAIREALGNKTRKERNEAYGALDEKGKKSKVFIRSVDDRVRNREKERVRERINARIRNAQTGNVTDTVREQLRNQTRTQERIERRIAHIDNMTAKKVGKLEDLREKLVNASEQKTTRLEEELNNPNISNAERARIEAQIAKSENKTERIQERIEERINKTIEKGENLKENAQRGNNGNEKGGRRQ